MGRLRIPSNKVIDLCFMSVLRPPQAREIFESFQRDDPQFSEAVISMVNGLAVAGEFAGAADLLKQHDSVITRAESNARQLLLFWFSFNRFPEALAELRRQEAAGRKDASMRTYALVCAANNNLLADTEALLEEAHTHDIPVPPWAYDRVMALFWRFNKVQEALGLVKEIQTRSPLHWQRPNGSLRYTADLLLRTNNWTEENVNTLLRVRLRYLSALRANRLGSRAATPAKQRWSSAPFNASTSLRRAHRSCRRRCVA